MKRHCMPVADPNGCAVPGIVIPFSITIATGNNFFGQPLAGGDRTFTPTSFSTKIRSSIIAFASEPQHRLRRSELAERHSLHLPHPDRRGRDALRDASVTRTWSVDDQAIPLPFTIANSHHSSQPEWVSAASLTEPAFTLRKHQAFRAVPDGTNFQSGYGFTNARLIGSSAWNSQCKIVNGKIVERQFFPEGKQTAKAIEATESP